MTPVIATVFDTSESDPLPQRCEALVDRVVKRSRLWRSEQRDIRAELTSHFREGLAELRRDGLSLEECIDVLCDEFGDANLAAGLIRRAKKRNRPMIWKVTVSIAAVGLLGMAAVGGFLAWITLAEPNPTIDYVAMINEPIKAVPEQDRAWPLWREVLPKVSKAPHELLPMNGKHLDKLRPGNENWPAAVAWVEHNADLMDRVTEAADRPVYGFIYGDKETEEYILDVQRREGGGDSAARSPQSESDPDAPRLMSILLPNLSEMRTLARLLILKSRIEADRGDVPAAFESLDVAQAMGIQLFSGFSLIEQLVGASIVHMSVNEMAELLNPAGPPLSEEMLDVIQGSRLLETPVDTIHINLDGEALFFKDTVQYLFTDDGKGNGRLIPQQFGKVNGLMAAADDDSSVFGADAGLIAMAAMHADRADTVAKYREIWREVDGLRALPLYDPRRGQMDEPMKELSEDPIARQRYALIVAMMPSFDRADTMVRESAMADAATQALAAMALFRADNDRVPEELEELVPDYLEQVPIDVYSGDGLVYFVDETGVHLYSVGANLVDDGGSGKLIKHPRELTRTCPADIVFSAPGASQ